MSAKQSINRRFLLQQMTALSLGAAVSPAIAFAGNSVNAFSGDAESSTIYLSPGEGKKGKVGEMEIVFKLEKTQTQGHLGVWESVIQPGELGAIPHYHNQYDEICRVVMGSVCIMTNEVVTEVKAGGWHLRPKGVIHTFWNSGSVPASTIDMSVPAGHEFYMQDLAKLFENNHRPRKEDLMQLSEKHDIHYRFDLLEAILKKYKVKL